MTYNTPSFDHLNKMLKLATGFWCLQENYLGEDDKFTPFLTSPPPAVEDDTVSTFTLINPPEEEEKQFDPRKYRPFSVTVSLTLHDIQAHLIRVGTWDTLYPLVFRTQIQAQYSYFGYRP